MSLFTRRRNAHSPNGSHSFSEGSRRINGIQNSIIIHLGDTLETHDVSVTQFPYPSLPQFFLLLLDAVNVRRGEMFQLRN